MSCRFCIGPGSGSGYWLERCLEDGEDVEWRVQVGAGFGRGVVLDGLRARR